MCIYVFFKFLHFTLNSYSYNCSFFMLGPPNKRAKAKVNETKNKLHKKKKEELPVAKKVSFYCQLILR